MSGKCWTTWHGTKRMRDWFIPRMRPSGSKDVKIVEKLPADSHQPVIYPIGVIKGTKEELLARAFVDSVVSPEGAEDSQPVWVYHRLSPFK